MAILSSLSLRSLRWRSSQSRGVAITEKYETPLATSWLDWRNGAFKLRFCFPVLLYGFAQFGFSSPNLATEKNERYSSLMVHDVAVCTGWAITYLVSLASPVQGCLPRFLAADNQSALPLSVLFFVSFRPDALHEIRPRRLSFGCHTSSKVPNVLIFLEVNVCAAAAFFFFFSFYWLERHNCSLWTL